jgi:hypothetical protein
LKKILLVIFIFLVATISFAQAAIETPPPYHIKTVSFVQSGINVLPFFRLGDRFEFQFDDLYANEADYYFQIEHYNYDWTLSQLQKNEYITGLDNQRIQDYENSINTLQSYSHYKVSFPNKFNNIIKTGNYLIKVFDDQEHLVFSRKFIVYEEAFPIGVTIRRSRDIEDVNQKHNVEIAIDYGAAQLLNPLETLKVSIFQNGYFFNAIHRVKPQYTLGTQLIYRYNKETQFFAGNEYHNFDNRNLRATTNMVASITSNGDMYNTVLYTNEPRKKQVYTFFPDVNGNFVVNLLGSENPELEADYSWVYFSLNAKTIGEKKNIYVGGWFNDYSFIDEYKLEYNPKKNVYEKAIMVKQGFTNYKYFMVDDKGYIDYKNDVDGNFFQTENNYMVFAYYRGPNDRYDRVVARGTMNSEQIKN